MPRAPGFGASRSDTPPPDLEAGVALSKTSVSRKAQVEKTGLPARKVDMTRKAILDATRDVLREHGFAGLSTRDVALAAGVPLSQIHYHFTSKQGLVTAMFAAENARLLDRQTAMYADPTMSISAQWDRACDYLDDDLKSGYVRTLLELWAAGWSDPEIAQLVRSNMSGWMDLLTRVAKRAEKELGTLDPFAPEDISALVGAAFIGAEAYLLLNSESKRIPVRRALRRIGEAIRRLERARIK
jgi:AcrR family transcriptional regulator